MKIYLYPCLDGFTNCYIVANEEAHEALIIDPGHISNQMIQCIEDGKYNLTGVLITHQHENHIKGLKTLQKIYSPAVYAADGEIDGEKTIVLRGDGVITVAELPVCYTSLPGHTPDSVIYMIGSALFTGDTIMAGWIGSTSSKYSQRLLESNIMASILSQQDDLVLLPGHGPPTTIAAEKLYNMNMAPSVQPASDNNHLQ